MVKIIGSVTVGSIVAFYLYNRWCPVSKRVKRKRNDSLPPPITTRSISSQQNIKTDQEFLNVSFLPQPSEAQLNEEFQTDERYYSTPISETQTKLIHFTQAGQNYAAMEAAQIRENLESRIQDGTIPKSLSTEFDATKSTPLRIQHPLIDELD